MFPGRQTVSIFSFLLTPLSGDIPGPVPGDPWGRQAECLKLALQCGARLGHNLSLVSQLSMVPYITGPALGSQQHNLSEPEQVSSPALKGKDLKEGSSFSWELGAKGMDFQTTLNFGPSVGGPAYCADPNCSWCIWFEFHTHRIHEHCESLHLGPFSHNCATICDLYPFIIYITWIILASSV